MLQPISIFSKIYKYLQEITPEHITYNDLKLSKYEKIALENWKTFKNWNYLQTSSIRHVYKRVQTWITIRSDEEPQGKRGVNRGNVPSYEFKYWPITGS